MCAMLVIKKSVLRQVIIHAEQKFPVEACGYLAGKEGVVDSHYELTNMDDREDHFSIDPYEQLRAIKAARACGRHLFAVYHSHPASAAYPSSEDVRLAYDPDIRYVIISLAAQNPDVKAFKIQAGEIIPEEIRLMGLLRNSA
jgi:proteasome lid subunit RPN8/RPN11